MIVNNYLNLIKNINFKYLRLMSSRPEQKKLRNYLLNYKANKCLICGVIYPPYILECAHIKPRKISNKIERNDFNIVKLMCRNCHKLYDYGDIGVLDTLIYKNEIIDDIELLESIDLDEYKLSEGYFEYHFKNIYKK